MSESALIAKAESLQNRSYEADFMENYTEGEDESGIVTFGRWISIFMRADHSKRF